MSESLYNIIMAAILALIIIPNLVAALLAVIEGDKA